MKDSEDWDIHFPNTYIRANAVHMVLTESSPEEAARDLKGLEGIDLEELEGVIVAPEVIKGWVSEYKSKRMNGLKAVELVEINADVSNYLKLKSEIQTLQEDTQHNWKNTIVRAKGVQLALTGASFNEVVKTLNNALKISVSLESVKDWVSVYKEEGIDALKAAEAVKMRKGVISDYLKLKSEIKALKVDSLNIWENTEIRATAVLYILEGKSAQEAVELLKSNFECQTNRASIGHWKKQYFSSQDDRIEVLKGMENNFLTKAKDDSTSKGQEFNGRTEKRGYKSPKVEQLKREIEALKEDTQSDWQNTIVRATGVLCLFQGKSAKEAVEILNEKFQVEPGYTSIGDWRKRYFSSENGGIDGLMRINRHKLENASPNSVGLAQNIEDEAGKLEHTISNTSKVPPRASLPSTEERDILQSSSVDPGLEVSGPGKSSQDSDPADGITVKIEDLGGPPQNRRRKRSRSFDSESSGSSTSQKKVRAARV